MTQTIELVMGLSQGPMLNPQGASRLGHDLLRKVKVWAMPGIRHHLDGAFYASCPESVTRQKQPFFGEKFEKKPKIAIN